MVLLGITGPIGHGKSTLATMLIDSDVSSVHLETGFVIGKNSGADQILRIGYGFDYNFSSFGPSAGGTHELNLTMSFRN